MEEVSIWMQKRINKATGLSVLPFCSEALPLDHPEDVLSLHDAMIFAVELDLRPRILANHHHVPDADLDVLVGAHRDDLGTLGLLLGRVGKYDPGLRGLLALYLLDHRPCSQRLELHLSTFSMISNEPRKCTAQATNYQRPLVVP